MKKTINEKLLNPTERFTETVEAYIKYRPSYPKEILEVLINDCGLGKDKIIADIGSGTGILAKLLLNYGSTVYCVEPNQAMRNAAEGYLKSYANFYSIDAKAEETTLKDNSIDIITVGTAFHWFWEGLRGRLLSTSYSLRNGETGYEQMLQELRVIFKRYQKNGIVEFLYNTKAYYGYLKIG